jgi:hypothetical protein
MMEEKSHLESLTLEINKSFDLIDKDIHWIMIKLLFNLILEMNRELLDLKELNISMTDFYFQSQFTNIPNLSNLISYNLTSLYLGDLDYVSFKSLIEFFHTEEYIENSQLKKLTLCLSKNIVAFRECKEEIKELIIGQNPSSLFELCLSCHFNIGHDELMEIMTSANGNLVQKYTFIMEMASEKDYMNVFRRANLFYLNKKFKSNIDKYLPLLKKFNLFEEQNMNIAKKLIRFLVPSNRKKVIFKKNTK